MPKFGEPGAPPRGPGRGQAVVDWSKYIKPEEDGCTEQLRLMRHVMLNPKGYDRSHAEKQMRKFQDKQPVQFNVQMARLEAEHRLTARGGEEGEARDMGGERAEQLIEELLESFYKEHGG